MAQRQTLPVLPLRGTVIFPGLTVPIAAGRPGTLRAIEAALKGDRLVFAVAQRENTDEPTPENLYTMGVIARIGQIQRGLGGVQLLLQGEQRATRAPLRDDRRLPQRRRQPGRGDGAGQRGRPGLRRPLQGDPRARHGARRAPRPARGGPPPGARLGDRRRAGSPTSSPATSSCRSPRSRACSRTSAVEERLRRVLVHVQRQIGMLEAQDEIKSQVQEELGERQREMYLREQMKAIQKELGDDDQSREITELREKLNKLELPPRRAPRSSASSAGSSAPAASRWKPRSSAPTSSGSPSCPGTPARTTSSTSRARRRARRGPLRPAGREGPRARVPRRAPAPRAGDWPKEVETTGEVPAGRLKEHATTPPRRSAPRTTSAPSPTRRRPRPARWPRARSCCSSARPASARRRSPSRSPARSGASTSAPRSAACATRPTSAATAAPTSAPCPAGSSRG